MGSVGHLVDGSCGVEVVNAKQRLPSAARPASQLAATFCGSPQGPNGPGTEYGSCLLETDTGTRLFFSGGGSVGTNTQDIYISRHGADGGFSPPKPVTVLNSAYDDAMPNVSRDGREIVFPIEPARRRGCLGHLDLDPQQRPRPWSAPVNLAATINTAVPETRPSLSWDGERLYFGHAGDIYVSHRTVQ